MYKIYCSALAFFLSICLYADNGGMETARSLYENGLYAQAMDMFQSMPDYGKDAVIDAYVVLCAQRQHLPGYEKMVDNYYSRYSSSSMCREIRKEQAWDWFDRGMYADALGVFTELPMNAYPTRQHAEYLFKKGYCFYKEGNDESALQNFANLSHLMLNDYSAPAQYMSGYICYGRKDFTQAIVFFAESAKDERFADISEYYAVNCLFELDRYKEVIGRGMPLIQKQSCKEGQRQRLARIVSESYLVLGQKDEARSLYDSMNAEEASANTRADHFFAGSLYYETGEYAKAVENFRLIQDRSDSLGQVTSYQEALSFLQLKNKVAALESFKSASVLMYDPKIREDAYFNYAKLAFDLNNDTSVFYDYLRLYSDKVRGEKIYSYMALTALANRDYQTAIDAYDRIDVLQGQEKNNYVHANYIRGVELLEAGAFRKAVPCMQAVTYYTERQDLVNQLARYGLAEANYRNGQYAEAVAIYNDLYNTSALYGLEEGESLPYNVAYSYFKNAEYAQAARWFGLYVEEGGKAFGRDAQLRLADCHYMQKQYEEASAKYEDYITSYRDTNEIYPYYQAAMCYGLSIDKRPKYKAEATKKMNRKVELLSMVSNADSSSAYYPEAMLELGRSYAGMKREKDALKVFSLLAGRLKGSPAAAQALLETGTVKRNLKDIDGALAAYKEVVSTMGSHSYADDALMAIESIYQSQNAPQKYLAYLDSIGRGESKTPEQKEEMFFTAAQQQFFADDYSSAIASFTSFMQQYPESGRKSDCMYYIAECYRLSKDKEKACETYSKVIELGKNKYTLPSLRQFAKLNFSMDNFVPAAQAYDSLAVMDSLDKGVLKEALAGAMDSWYKAKEYVKAEERASAVLAKEEFSAGEKAHAGMLRAKSLLAVSRRDEAFAQLALLAADPKSEEGAEAAYMIILDCYDRADFDAVKEKVYAFSDSGTSRMYYLAKAFIILGDSFVEQGKTKQAEATFKSVAEGYPDNAEIQEDIQMRLEKLAQQQ